MRKILLTSSQVSVLLSSFIIISSTLALFLSGYAIQQRTLRELRAAVRPRQPRQSRPSPKTYLPDQFKTAADGPPTVNGQQAQDSNDDAADFGRREDVVVEVKQTEPEPEPAPASEPETEHAGPRRDHADVSSEKLAILESIQNRASQKAWAVDNPDPDTKSRVPVTRAERRRMIKAEIQRLSRSEERVYYQRRLW